MILCGDRFTLTAWRNELTVALFNEANQVLEVDEARLAATLDALFRPQRKLTGKKWRLLSP